VYLLYCVVATLVVGELTVRVSGYADHYATDPIYAPFPGSAEIPYVHRPNLRHARAWGSTLIDTDERGLRIEAATFVPDEPSADGLRIAMVGDSVTFGEGVRTQDTFAEVVVSELARLGYRAPVRTFNFGVSAYSVQTMAATLAERVPAVHPGLAAVLVIPADFDVSRTGKVDDEGYVWWSNGGKPSPVKRLLRRSTFAYFVRDLVTWRTKTWDTPRLGEVPASYRYIERIHSLCGERVPACVLILLGTNVDSGFGAVHARLLAEGLPVIDLSALPRTMSRAEFDVGAYNAHPSARVHRIIAAELARWVLANEPPRPASLSIPHVQESAPTPEGEAASRGYRPCRGGLCSSLQ